MDPLDRLADAVRRLAEETEGRALSGLTHHDADDEVGTSATDDAVGFDPLPLLRTLHQHGARVAVIGQVAGILHGSRELTGDLDLLWDGDLADAPAMAAAFAAAGASLTDDDGQPVASTAAAFELPKVLFRAPAASGDCCTPKLPWGDIAVGDFLTRCEVAVADDGTEVRYVNRADLIRMRRAIGRPKDLRRADELDRL
jgi:hypothetical protein